MNKYYTAITKHSLQNKPDQSKKVF